jgi:hypothetical protein
MEVVPAELFAMSSKYFSLSACEFSDNIIYYSISLVVILLVIIKFTIAMVMGPPFMVQLNR